MRLIAALALALFCTVAHAETTKVRAPACVVLDHIKRIVGLIRDKEFGAADELLQVRMNAGQCTLIPKDRRVTVLDRDWGWVQVSYRGVQVWTHRDALK